MLNAFDISKHKQTDTQLQQLTDQLQALIKNLPGGAVFVVDQELRYIIADGEALTDVGVESTDFVGKTIFEALEAANARAYEPLYRQALRGEPFADERLIGGRYFSTKGAPLRNESGEIYAVLAVSYDITERKRMEEALRDADRRKDEFLAMLAHELRNPLTSMHNGLQILELATEQDELTGSAIAMMSRQLGYLVRLIDDLLDVSRISQGKIELRWERLDLKALVQQATDATRPVYEERRRRLTVTLPDSPLYIHGDPTRLTQVVTNLLTNGVRYTGDDGQVWVTLESVDGEAVLRVQDNGIGLAADQLTAIFDLFVQVDNSLARSQGGLGVGLTLVKRLLDMHGGRIDAHSTGLGQGSTFTVYLPHLPEPSMSLNAVEQTQPLTPGRRILVVDDNHDAADTLTMLLKLKKNEVHTRYGGREALVAAEALKPDVVLLDIGMPELDGYETARLIRQQPWGQRLVIIALTGYGQEEDRRRAQEAGFNGHLVKPVDLADLLQALDSLTGS